MINYIEKNLFQGVCNSNEFKGWLLSRRWFGDKSALSNLDFSIIVDYFELIAERILLTVIEIKTSDYSKSYFLPLIHYKKIEEILEPSEKAREVIIRLTENTFSKKIALSIENEPKVITLNLLEAEFCLFFWKKMLFDINITEQFPSMNLELSLYTKQFEDEKSMKKVQNLIEAGLHPERYEFSTSQLGKGNTTNTLFLLNITNTKFPNELPISYVLKSYKEYTVNIEPSTLFNLVKNKFPNAPKIYGSIKVNDKETIGIIESVPNIENFGDIFWNELNILINDVFKDIDLDYSYINERSNVSKIIKEYCGETIKVSSEIGDYIKNLHKSLILPDQNEFSLESVDSSIYLKNYTDKLNSMISKLQGQMTQQPESAFFNLPKISSILIDIKATIERFRSEFEKPKIEIQPVHQDLHLEQILYDKIENQYNFYFIDFEGDPMLSLDEKKEKFPVEKDLASLLRALSYIKFNTLLKFIENRIIRKDKYEVPEEILYNLFFRRGVRPKNKVLDDILNVLNTWESKLIGKILKNLNMSNILITYFYIQRALHELTYELLYRPNKIIVPVLGLKEIVEKN
ncbi:hypothetical protein LCGC14_1667040 [marine sediment metagenome]|uniref:Aminoglycoside phosphotransferase domain-containing protein n=1 Tax=marine sediment metagenome TaxID=412755 RepID=A0A0F9IEZ8_9ZZZZ